MEFFFKFWSNKRRRKYAKFIHLRIWNLFFLTVIEFSNKKRKIYHTNKIVSKSKEMRSKKIIFVFITTSSDDPLN